MIALYAVATTYAAAKTTRARLMAELVAGGNGPE